MVCSYLSEREEITNLILSYIFQICLGMLKSSEHRKLSRYSNYDSPYLKDCSKVRSADPPILFFYSILRIGGLVTYRELSSISDIKVLTLPVKHLFENEHRIQLFLLEYH